MVYCCCCAVFVSFSLFLYWFGSGFLFWGGRLFVVCLFSRRLQFTTSLGKQTVFSKAQRMRGGPALIDSFESHHFSRMIYLIAIFYLILYQSASLAS